MSFKPSFEITAAMAQSLMRIEAAKETVARLPITPALLGSLRRTTRLQTTHYSTMIEGNRLSEAEVREVILHEGHFAGRERDEREVLGVYVALDHVEKLAGESRRVTETDLKRIHALIMGGGRKRVRPTPYRDGQNVIREGATGYIVYMPPKAEDVPSLMGELIEWTGRDDGLPSPLRAGLAHYQYATIHPYYDGNGRTARLLATLILHRGGYSLKGIYCLEEYYARDLHSYYNAFSLGPSHNYYLGRAEADITPWLEYFCAGMADSFEAVSQNAEAEARKGAGDSSALLRKLDARKRKALGLFEDKEEIASADVASLFGVGERAGRAICRKWVEEDFLAVGNPAKRNRSYVLSNRWRNLIKS